METINGNDGCRISSLESSRTLYKEIPVKPKMQILRQRPAGFEYPALPKGRRLVQQIHQPDHLKIESQRAGSFDVRVGMGGTELDAGTIHKVRAGGMGC